METLKLSKTTNRGLTDLEFLEYIQTNEKYQGCQGCKLLNIQTSTKCFTICFLLSNLRYIYNQVFKDESLRTEDKKQLEMIQEKMIIQCPCTECLIKSVCDKNCMKKMKYKKRVMEKTKEIDSRHWYRYREGALS